MAVTASKKASAGADEARDVAILWKLEDDWMTDRLAADSGSSMQLIDEAYRGATSFGEAQTKAAFLQATEKASGTFTELVQSDRFIQFCGSAAISTGVATLRGPGKQHAFRYLRVFAKKQGKWRLISSLSTPLSS